MTCDACLAVVGFSTVGTQADARKIARTLVEKRLVACANIVPKIESVYHWQGKICTDAEHLLIFKTSKKKLEKVKETIPLIHPYEVPELIFFPVADGLPAYLQWIAESTEDK